MLSSWVSGWALLPIQAEADRQWKLTPRRSRPPPWVFAGKLLESGSLNQRCQPFLAGQAVSSTLELQSIKGEFTNKESGLFSATLKNNIFNMKSSLLPFPGKPVKFSNCTVVPYFCLLPPHLQNSSSKLCVLRSCNHHIMPSVGGIFTHRYVLMERV